MCSTVIDECFMALALKEKPEWNFIRSDTPMHCVLFNLPQCLVLRKIFKIFSNVIIVIVSYSTFFRFFISSECVDVCLLLICGSFWHIVTKCSWYFMCEYVLDTICATGCHTKLSMSQSVNQSVDFIVVIFFSSEFYIDSRHEKSLDKLMERYQ